MALLMNQPECLHNTPTRQNSVIGADTLANQRACTRTLRRRYSMPFEPWKGGVSLRWSDVARGDRSGPHPQRDCDAAQRHDAEPARVPRPHPPAPQGALPPRRPVVCGCKRTSHGFRAFGWDAADGAAQAFTFTNLSRGIGRSSLGVPH